MHVLCRYLVNAKNASRDFGKHSCGSDIKMLPMGAAKVKWTALYVTLINTVNNTVLTQT